MKLKIDIIKENIKLTKMLLNVCEFLEKGNMVNGKDELSIWYKENKPLNRIKT